MGKGEGKGQGEGRGEGVERRGGGRGEGKADTAVKWNSLSYLITLWYVQSTGNNYYNSQD